MLRKLPDLGRQSLESSTMQLEKFLQSYANYHDIEDSTIEQYRYVLACFGRHLGREPRLSDLTPDTVNAWLASLKDKLSPFTAKTRRMTILSLWNEAAGQDLIDPPKRIRKIKTPPRVITVLTTDQVHKLLHATAGYPGLYCGYRWEDLLRTWIQATLETSMRAGDMRTLEYSDLLYTRGQFTLIQRKSRVARRVVLSAGLMSDLASWHRPDGLVWPMGDRSIIIRKLSDVGERCGLTVTHTLLRQTAISDVEAQRPGCAWKFAGHASPATTQRWYIDHEHAYQDLPRPRF